MGTEPSNWFIKDNSDIVGPLSEVEMRRIVMSSSSPSLFVRQGTSDWHPAEVIRNKITELANKGFYIKANGIAEGPFTFTKAYEVLQTPKYDQADVRIGLNGPWFPASHLIAKVEELKREREAQIEGEPQPGAMADVANQAGRFLEQMGQPGSHLLASPSISSLQLNQKRFLSKIAVFAIGIVCISACLGFAGWKALHAYQCRHLSARYRIDARPDAARLTPKVSTGGPIAIVPGQLFRPTFTTTLGQVTAGTAFSAKASGRESTLIVSTLQLLGPVGGLSSDIPAHSITKQWQGLALQDIVSAERFSDVPMQPVMLRNAATFPNDMINGDIVVCIVTNTDMFQKTALPLSSHGPQVGERVWLVADVSGSNSLLHAAVIAAIEDGWLVYKFEELNLRLQATNGAPVLDQTGNVIAVNAAGGEEHGRTFGIGTPVAEFYDYLLSEL